MMTVNWFPDLTNYVQVYDKYQIKSSRNVYVKILPLPKSSWLWLRHSNSEKLQKLVGKKKLGENNCNFPSLGGN